MMQLSTSGTRLLYRCSPMKGYMLNCQHSSMRWRAPATFLDSTRGAASILRPLHASSSSQGGGHVRVSWFDRARSGDPEYRAVEVSAKDWEGLQAVLACSDGALRQVVQQWPSFASLPPPFVMHRLLCLKALLPGCNVATMVQLQPQLFFAFDKTTQELQTQVGTAYDIISRELPAEYVDAMIEENPNILFINGGCLPDAVLDLKKPKKTAARKPPTTRPTGVIIAVQPPRMRQGVLAAAPSAVPAGSAAQKRMPAKPKCAQEGAAGALDKSKAAPCAQQKVSDLDAAQVEAKVKQMSAEG